MLHYRVHVAEWRAYAGICQAVLV